MYKFASLGISPLANATAAVKASTAAAPAGGDKKKKDYDLGIYGRFGFAGALCCSITHTAVVPIDVVKTRLQTSPGKYKGMLDGFKRIPAEEGASMLLKGAGPTALGYFLQGAAKFGFNEFFKKQFMKQLSAEDQVKYRLPVWMCASASAEFIADLFLCPLEATRIRLVSNPTYAKGLIDGFGTLLKNEGFLSFYRGLPPLLFKQVPYTVAKFSVFELFSEAVYRNISTPKDQLSTGSKLSISLGSGLVAGFAAALISQPADTVLSKIAQDKSATIGGVMKKLGASGLFLGVGARLAMVGTLTAGQFFIYDGCKELMGVTPAQLTAKGY